MRRLAIIAALALSAAGTANADGLTLDTVVKEMDTQRTTEIQRADWWRSWMAGHDHAFTARVSDVQEKMFGGFEVVLKGPRSSNIYCQLPKDAAGLARRLKKGDKFTCTGTVGRTWTEIFGLGFRMEYTGQGA